MDEEVSEFEKRLTLILKKSTINPLLRPRSNLYHYTSGDGLQGIVRDKNLWATHYKYLNDSTEIRYAFEILKKVVREKKKTASRIVKSILDGIVEPEGGLLHYADVYV